MRPVSQMRCLMAKSWSEVATPDSGRLQTTLNAAQTSPRQIHTFRERSACSLCQGRCHWGHRNRGGPCPQSADRLEEVTPNNRVWIPADLS